MFTAITSGELGYIHTEKSSRDWAYLKLNRRPQTRWNIGKGDQNMGIREELADNYGVDILFADGYDDAIIGVCIGCDAGRVVYDAEKMVDICAKDLETDHEEALEFLEFNTFCAYVGDNTPIYLMRH
jgi:hypothetical protein